MTRQALLTAIGIRRHARSTVKRTADHRPFTALGVVIAFAGGDAVFGGLMNRALLCCLLLWPFSAQAQFTLEIGSDPAASLLGRMLQDCFGQSDPSLLIVFSGQMRDADLVTALRTGALDVALVSPLRPDVADDLQGMRFEIIGRSVPRLAGLESEVTQPISGELYSVFPESPSIEVSRFLVFVRSHEGAD